MWILRHLIAGARAPSGPVRYVGAVTRWQRVKWKDTPGLVSACHIPDDHRDAAEIRAMVKHFGSTSIVADSEVRTDTPPPAVATMPGPADVFPVASPPQTKLSESDIDSIARAVGLDRTAPALGGVLYLGSVAKTNGWHWGDFLGTGRLGDPGPGGGRSPECGLTLSEMALARPPVDWDELHGKGRPPWESSDWTPPGAGWVPPSWPERPAADPTPELDPSKPADLKPGEILDQEAYAAALAAGRIAEIPPGSPASSSTSTPLVDTDELDKGATDSDGAETPDDPLASYPADQLAQAAEIARDLTKRQNKVPHPNAVDFVLKAAGLAPLHKIRAIAKMQIAALLAEPPTP